MKKLSLVVALVMGGVCVLLAQRTITGTVSDTNGEPLIGATVLAKGTSTGTTTDENGAYELSIPNDVTILLFSYTGYQPKEVNIGNSNTLDVTLETSVIALTDVVVIGYGTASRRELTGSVVKVSGETISKLPITGVDQALQGQAPGIQVTQNSGTPGGAVSVRVRGASSITAGNQPLYVVDGIPLNNVSLSQLNFGNQQDNPLANINPSDIESIEVLKDAAAAAIYGSRASNGVVIITTKRGKQQKTSINVNTYYGTQEAWKNLEPLPGPEYVSLLNEMVNNRFPTDTTSNRNLKTTLGILNRDPQSYPNTNWQDEIFRNAPISNTDLSFSGGNERTKFFVGTSYFTQQGTILGSNFDRYSARINLDNLISDKFKIGTSTSLSRSKSNRIINDNNINGVLSTAVLLGSHIPAYNADGTYAKDPNSSTENPIAAAREPTNDNINDRILTNIFGEYEIFPALSFRSSWSLDYINFREFRFSPTTTNTGAGTKGSGTEALSQNVSWITENYFTFRKAFNNLNLDALLGASFQNTDIRSFTAQGDNFPGNSIRTLNASSVYRNISSTGTGWGLNSYFSRVNLSYNQKYFLSASARADGSSRFGADNRWGLFPAASVAWRISEEGFLKDNSLISELKIKASWGLRGNQDFPNPALPVGINGANFQALSIIQPGFNYNQSAGLAPTQLGNPSLTWEEREDIDLGLELGLFNDRINLTVEAYQGTTNELLLNRPLSEASGYTGINQNIGSIRNRGIDIGLTTYNIESDKFSWSTNFNISFFENEVLKLAGAPFASGFASWVEEGYPIGAFRGYEVAKVFQTQDEINALNAKAKEMTGNPAAVYQSTLTRPGDLMFNDLNGDGTVTGADQKIIGDANPTFFGGMTNTLRGFGFDLSVFLQFSYGNEVWNHTRLFAEGMNGVFGQLASVRNRWTPSNPTEDTRYPRAVWGDPNNNRRTSDRYLEDGSYLRLKNVTLGYTLPSSISKKLRISNLRVYATGQNLLTFTDYSGFDPEVSTFAEGVGQAANTAPGTDFLTFPLARVIIFGLNVGF
ncbi:MAG: SusC/RagA family TonB-linked outer membrane protein [Saprospiraceae bacterium]